ncbi:MAG: GDP-6-deoxy-D-mannose reductase [Anaerolineae bacterium]|nr:MAG: NAD-dependent epimerase/dehydratase [Chloroflexi bacterium OLB13]MBV6435388.1 GDP-6-deoxy-D-mannose reductase [Anaerolineae bacterium]
MPGAGDGPDGVTCYEVDLCRPAAVVELIAEVRPDHIYHLAGQAFVPQSFIDPWDTIENNVRGQLNVILACLKADIRPRLLITSSAEIYGEVKTFPTDETTPLMPTSPYSVSKAAQDQLAYQYFVSHDMPTLRIRAFNHIGPGQSDRFVAPAFAMQIARIEAGLQEPVINVGDLTARRDFTDVRDVVRAYSLLMKHGVAGEAYNVASGVAHSIQHLLDMLVSLSSQRIEVRVDPNRLRPSPIPVLQGDASKLRHATGWAPQIPFESSLRDVLEDCRARIRGEHA